jgi:hypothetical protein
MKVFTLCDQAKRSIFSLGTCPNGPCSPIQPTASVVWLTRSSLPFAQFFSHCLPGAASVARFPARCCSGQPTCQCNLAPTFALLMRSLSVVACSIARTVAAAGHDLHQGALKSSTGLPTTEMPVRVSREKALAGSRVARTSPGFLSSVCAFTYQPPTRAGVAALLC